MWLGWAVQFCCNLLRAWKLVANHIQTFKPQLIGTAKEGATKAGAWHQTRFDNAQAATVSAEVGGDKAC